MPTRTEVEAAIAAIDDDGNNKAVEVRDVLTKLLDYTENEAVPPQQLIPFNFVTEGPITDNATGSELQYSCRGFEGAFANFTFQLRISDNSDNNIFFFRLQDSHADDMLAIMEELLPTDAMRFSIPFRVVLGNQETGAPNIFSFAIPTNISFFQGDSNAVIRFDMDFSLATGQGIPDFSLTNALAYTSICFHSNGRIIDETLG